MGVNPDQCRLFSIAFFSLFFVTSFLTIILFPSIFSFLSSTFNKEKHSLFFEKNGNTTYTFFYGQKIFVCALGLCKSLLFVLIFFDFKNRTDFDTPFKRVLFCNLCWEKPRASLLKICCSSWFTSFFSSFIDSCSFCGRNHTDIGRGSSVAASRLIPFLLSSSFLAFIDFSSFSQQCFSLFFVPFCKFCFFLPLFSFVCLFFLTFFFPPFLKLFLFQLFLS